MSRILSDELLQSLNISSVQKNAVSVWWQSFTKYQKSIADSFTDTTKASLDTISWMRKYLHTIDEGLMWEFGPGMDKTHRLVITSESNNRLRPLIHYILSEAPDFEHWEFSEYRVAEELDYCPITMKARAHWQDLSKITFELTQGYYNTVGIIYYIPSSLSLDSKQKDDHNGYVLTESLLGEENLHKWVESIEIKIIPKKKFLIKAICLGQPLSSLKQDFQKMVDGVKSRLPKEPYYKMIRSTNVKWIVVSVSNPPDKQEEYTFKQDFQGSTFLSTEGDLISAIYSGYEFFHSARFSNYNEKFFYLKIYGSRNSFNQKKLDLRMELENSLDRRLQEENIGCIIGRGTGLKYTYVNFAIIDVSKSILIIQSILQKANITRKSWILFHDCTHQSEWIGIWNDSPPPPM